MLGEYYNKIVSHTIQDEITSEKKNQVEEGLGLGFGVEKRNLKRRRTDRWPARRPARREPLARFSLGGTARHTEQQRTNNVNDIPRTRPARETPFKFASRLDSFFYYYY